MQEHPRVRLEEVCDVIAGPSGSLLEGLRDGLDGVPVIGPPNLADDHTIDTGSLRRLPEERASKLDRFRLRAGDLIVVRQGALGRLAVVGSAEQSWLVGPSCLRVRIREGRVLPEFLAWHLSHPSVQAELVQRASIGTVPAFNAAVLRDVQLSVPPVAEQEVIAETLDAVQAQASRHRAAARRLDELCPSLFAELLRTRRHV